MIYEVSRRFAWSGEVTTKVGEVMRMFGLDVQRVRDNCVEHNCKVDIRQGDVCYITGASGAGKSVILRGLYEQFSDNEKINIEDIDIDGSGAVVDRVEGCVIDSLRALSKAGLSDVFSVLDKPRHLSEGQRYRYRLASALASGRKVIFADEFCSNLDRITAAVISYNIRKFARRNNITMILASSHDDILGDLAPDVVVIKHLSGLSEVVYRDVRRTEENRKGAEI